MSLSVPIKPRFSVVLPTHDRRDLLREAIDSVVRQTCDDWELIIVDDASVDPISEDELRDLAGSGSRLVRLAASQGGAAAKTAGARVAKGQLLAFLDDDDLWHPDYLERADAAFRSTPDVKVLFMGVKWFGERAPSGQQAQDSSMQIVLEQARAKQDSAGLVRFGPELFEALLGRVPMPFQRPVTYREDFFAIGEYRPHCLLWDCDWALRAVLHGECALLDEGLYLQRAAGQGYSSQSRRALEHTRSNLEIKESLLRHPAVVNSSRRQLVMRALHGGWIGYAWQLRQLREWKEATQALRRAAKYGFSGELIRMYIASLVKRI